MIPVKKCTNSALKLSGMRSACCVLGTQLIHWTVSTSLPLESSSLFNEARQGIMDFGVTDNTRTVNCRSLVAASTLRPAQGMQANRNQHWVICLDQVIQINLQSAFWSVYYCSCFVIFLCLILAFLSLLLPNYSLFSPTTNPLKDKHGRTKPRYWCSKEACTCRRRWFRKNITFDGQNTTIFSWGTFTSTFDVAGGSISKESAVALTVTNFHSIRNTYRQYLKIIPQLLNTRKNQFCFHYGIQVGYFLLGATSVKGKEWPLTLIFYFSRATHFRPATFPQPLVTTQPDKLIMIVFDL